MRLKRVIAALTVLLVAVPFQTRAEWKAIEKTATYAISGHTGPELYASIGENGPKAGNGSRAIAHTNFRLTWRRDYQRRGNACVLASAIPKLVITTTLPEPAGALAEPLRSHWKTFIAGVRAHEAMHGQMIRELVVEIEKATIGLAVENDPKCRLIRDEMNRRLSAISAAHQARNREYDWTELGEGGAVHQLILALVNGG